MDDGQQQQFPDTGGITQAQAAEGLRLLSQALTESRTRTTVSVLDLQGKPDDPLYVGPVA